MDSKKISNLKVVRSAKGLQICVNSSIASGSGRSFPLLNGEYDVNVQYESPEKAMVAETALGMEFCGLRDGVLQLKQGHNGRYFSKNELFSFLRQIGAHLIEECLQEA